MSDKEEQKFIGKFENIDGEYYDLSRLISCKQDKCSLKSRFEGYRGKGLHNNYTSNSNNMDLTPVTTTEIFKTTDEAKKTLTERLTRASNLQR